MTVLEARPDVAKKKGRPKTGSNNVPVKMDEQLLRDAKTIALQEGLSVVDYLNRILAPVIKRDLDKTTRKMLERSRDTEG